MRRVTQAVLVVIAVLGLSGNAVLARATPDFSGKWAGSNGPNDILTITQNATMLSISRADETTIEYQSTGIPFRRTYELADGRTVDVQTFGHWNGDAFTIVTINKNLAVPGLSAKTYEELSLDVSGNLIVRTTRYVVLVSTDTYKKVL